MALAAIALVFLLVVAGAVVALRGNSPFDKVLRDAAVLSTLVVPLSDAGPYGNLWRPVVTPISDDDPVISRYDRTRAFHGLTMVLRSDESAVDLVTMEGEIAHRWTLPGEIDWTTAQQGQGSESAPTVYPRRAVVFANGDIIIVVESPDVTPYGMGLVKLDRNSHLIWRISESLHHDLAVQEDGTIYALGHEISTKSYLGLPRLHTPYIRDYVAVISDTGEIRKKIYIIDAFYNSVHWPSLTAMHFDSLLGDYTHSNTIKLIDQRQADRLPFADPGQLLISMREMNTIAVLDPAQEKIVWSMAGMWFRQHEPGILPNGNMLIFDNLGHIGPELGSRVIEFDPVTQRTEWLYAGRPDDPLFTLGYGAQQRLPNDNILIVESENGRIIEVTRDKEVVWQYRTPGRRHKDGTDYVAVVPSAMRFGFDELPFLNTGP